MTFSSKVKQTPQTLWKELKESGGRLLLTIPYNSDIEKANGFIAINGSDKEEYKDIISYPILTVCVENVQTERCTVSTLVFPSSDEYIKFVSSLWLDCFGNFDLKKNKKKED